VLLKQSGLDPGFQRFGVGSEYDMFAPHCDQSEAVLIVGGTVAPSGYAWVCPWGHGRVRVGVGVVHPDSSENPERYLDSQARFHRLETDPAVDPVLMKRGLDPNVTFDRIQTPVILTYPGARHALLMLADVRSEFRALIAPLPDVLAHRARWQQVAAFEDEVTEVEIDGDTLYLLANRGCPRGRILATSVAAPSLTAAREVAPQGPMVIEDVPGKTPPPIAAALQYQQRDHMERGVEYARKVLGLGVRRIG